MGEDVLGEDVVWKTGQSNRDNGFNQLKNINFPYLGDLFRTFIFLSTGRKKTKINKKLRKTLIKPSTCDIDTFAAHE